MTPSTATRAAPPLPEPRLRPRRPGSESARQWQLNWRLLIGTVLTIGVLTALATVWHSAVVRRNGAVFLNRADALADEQKWDEAARHLHRYLKLFPGDDEVRTRLALTFDHVADAYPEKIRAAERLYSVAVGVAPDRADLRRGHAQRLLQLRRYGAARSEAERVIELLPGDPRAMYIRAMAIRGDARLRGDQASLERLAVALQDAIAAQPGTIEHVSLATQLADLYRRDIVEPSAEERKASADKVMDDMVAANGDKPDAWIARYSYHRRFGDAASSEDLDRALKTDVKDKNVDVQLAAAGRAMESDDHATAQSFYEKARVASPNDPRPYLGLARSYLSEGHTERAIDTLRTGIRSAAQYRALELDLPLIDALITDGDAARMDEAEKQLTTTSKKIDGLAGQLSPHALNNMRGQFDALWSRWHMVRQEYGPAAGLLRKSLLAQESVLAGTDEVVARASLYMQLGQCYAAQRKFDQAATAFKDAAALQPEAVQPRLAAARAWQAAGRVEEAVRECRQATLLSSDDASAWSMFVELQIQQQLQLPAQQRNWTPVEAALKSAQKAFPDAESLRTMALQVSDLRSGSGQTVTLLEKAHAADPTSLAAAERLVAAYESAGRSDDADRTVVQFEESGARPADVVVLRAALLVQRDDMDGAERVLRDGIDRLASDGSGNVKRRLAGLYLRLQKLDQAKAILVELVNANATDEVLLSLLADLAMQARNTDDMLRWETELRKQEGPDGTHWRFYRAQRLLIGTESSPGGRLETIDDLAGEIQRLRPLWSAGFVLRAQIAERLGKTTEAIDALQKAIELGDHQPSTVERLATMLFAANRFDEADQSMRRLSALVTSVPRLANLAISISLRKGDSAAAVELARKVVAQQPRDAGRYAMLAQTLLTIGKPDEAEAVFRQAVEIDPENPASWQGLFGCQAASGRTDVARETVKRMASAVKLSAAELQLLLGQNLSLLGDREAAEAHYRHALALAPRNAQALRRLAGLLATSNPDEAEHCLREVQRLQPSSGVARNDLVSYLISRGGDDRLAEAWALLDSPAPENDDPAEVQGLRARLLVRRGRNGDRDRAKELLNDLVARGTAKDGDRLMLVGMLRSDGNTREALGQASVLANREKPVPDHLAAYVDLLMAHGRTKEAKASLARLIELDPNGFATMSLKARLVAAEGHKDGIESLVEDYLTREMAAAKSDAAKAGLLLAVANLYAQIPLDPAAERTYRRLSVVPTGDRTPLALWLARHRRTSEALDLCLPAAEADATPRSVIAVVQSLIVGQANTRQGARAEPVIVEGLKRHPGSADLLFAVGTWRLIQERADEAAALLRKVLAIQPSNVMAMNNLVNSLAEQPATRSEAMRLVDEALGRVGRVPELLDTKGTILMLSEDYRSAVPLLEEAVSRPQADPLHKLHMAFAYHRVGRPAEARRLLGEARAGLPDTLGLRARDVRTLKELERSL
ncbi:MAG: tetratricopeptide repeat protein [Planctomycetia bacterium]|nr:tetratricopeptide repeat protein [Planctomycetia bacterium]